MDYRNAMNQVGIGALCAALLACQASPPSTPLGVDTAQPRQSEIPANAPAKVTTGQVERYSLSAHRLPASEVLERLARLADFNLVVHGELDQPLTLVARDQTVADILQRIGDSHGLRYEWRGDTLVVTDDGPHWRHYDVPYVNVERTSERDTALDRSTDSSADRPRLSQQSEHLFWQNLESQLESFDSDKILVNRDVGLVSVRGGRAEQRAIERYLDRVVSRGQRQVLIEATVIEVELSNSYRAGVNWQRMASRGDWSVEQTLTEASLGASPLALVAEHQRQSSDALTRATVTLLQEYGDVNIHSQPRIIALNNQPSLLKVVDNRVYFTIDVENTTASGGATSTTVETHINTLPVGFTMSVTPFVTNADVMLSVRPTLSRITRFVDDPSPALAAEGVVSQVPEVEVRQMETLLRLHGDQTALIGGLMQERRGEQRHEVPFLGRLPLIGALFRGEKQLSRKTELIIMLRARHLGPAREGEHA
ncbi:MAG: hypothetical protein ACQES2_12045 [Pseudomonadota bacterium]